MAQMTPCMHLVFVGDLRRYVIAVKVSMDTFCTGSPSSSKYWHLYYAIKLHLYMYVRLVYERTVVVAPF